MDDGQWLLQRTTHDSRSVGPDMTIWPPRGALSAARLKITRDEEVDEAGQGDHGGCSASQTSFCRAVSLPAGTHSGQTSATSMGRSTSPLQHHTLPCRVAGRDSITTPPYPAAMPPPVRAVSPSTCSTEVARSVQHSKPTGHLKDANQQGRQRSGSAADALPSTASQGYPEAADFSRESLEDESTTSPFQPSPLVSHANFSAQPSVRSARSFSQPSPVSIAQVSLLPQQHGSSTHGTEASLFESRAVLNRPYEEPVAYQNVTPFGPAQEHGPKPDYEAIAYNAHDTRETRPPSYGSQQHLRRPRRVMDAWRPGHIMRFPVWGFGALLGVIAFTGASLGILLASDGDRVSKWQVNNIQPSVYLSGFSLIMDSLAAFALAEGLTVRFWTQAMRGVFISVLYDIFESGWLSGALRCAIRLRFNMVAVACLLAAVSTTRGPFFQRASTVTNDLLPTSGTIDIQMASNPLIDYFESATTDQQIRGSFTPELSALVRNFSAGAPFPHESPGCGDICTATAKGIGFNVTCTTSEQSFDLTSLPESCKTCTDKTCRSHCKNLAAQDYNFNFFSVGYNTSDDQSLTLFTTFKTEPNCAGTIQTHTCSLTQGTVTYPITLTNNTISRQNSHENLTNQTSSESFNTTNSLDPKFITKYWPTLFSTLFPPIAVNVSIREDFGAQLYTKCAAAPSNAWAEPSSNASSCSGTTPPFLQDLGIRYATPSLDASGNAAGDVCNATFRDPMPDLVDGLQELAFRISLAMALANSTAFLPGMSAAQVDDARKGWAQRVDYHGWETATVFHTNGTYVALGVIASLLGVLATLPLYNQWWELGRRVSLNPLEVGRAFGAPVLDGLDGNAGAARVVAEQGDKVVRYGVVERYGAEKKLRIEAAGSTRAPWQNEVFG
ncbi:uncharacterized protein BDZ99DRAFT_470525 [Mytilinidion resinicola]|uniref:Uncharacterized protein n=1 Tax=Mytilinidion resinicola TaxID=574789 RepID=A0A6A6Z945_9PEZI|nr:uncharacterized protein BDZ99DRAFT_470525 [Mytilinidion resinicola]KAF2817536.1 hypothetical protein BDZ99DRAFT_470525 [Mytilinidion resinicola]